MTIRRSIANLGPAYNSLVRPLDPPPAGSLPAEIDDFYLYDNRIEPQPPEMPPVVIGSNLISSIHASTCLPILDSAPPEPFGESQIPTLSTATETVRHGLNTVGNLITAFAGPLGQVDMSPDIYLIAEKRRATQMELQKAAAQMAALASRGYFLSWLGTQIQRQESQDINAESENSMLIELDNAADNDSLEKANALRDAKRLLREEATSLTTDSAVFLRALTIQHVEPNAKSFVRLLFTLELHILI
jgi:hypothetical protein